MDEAERTGAAGASAGIGRRAAAGGLAGLIALPAAAIAQSRPQGADPHAATAASRAAAPPDYPPPSVTRHTIVLPGRTLAIEAVAGAIRVNDASGDPAADIAYIYYRRTDGDRMTRPVTFVMNGGPGYASAWLQLGAVGPWHLRMLGDADRPTAPPYPTVNPDTWLDFTDLVFVDPAGCGFSRIVGDAEARKALLTVDGDIDSLAQMIRRWLERHDRLLSPKFFLGESYGGFRGPLLTEALAKDQGVGLQGIVLISPVLDFGGYSTCFVPLAYVAWLPSMAAANRAQSGPVTRESIVDAEAYARGEFLTDLIRGERDRAAVDRIVARVTALTGLDPRIVRERNGRITPPVFLRQRVPDHDASRYDATVLRPDPWPDDPRQPVDPLLDGLSPVFQTAMEQLYAQTLEWSPPRLYRLYNEGVGRHWTFGNPRPQAISPLRRALAIDPTFRVAVVQGIFDLVTPYVMNAILLDQIPPSVSGDRVRHMVVPGGHMVYSVPVSRALLRAEGERIVRGA